MAKQELLAAIRDRYRGSSRKDMSRILDEFVMVTGHHRKHGIRLLAQSQEDPDASAVALLIGCKKVSLSVSAEFTCGCCNGGCRNDEASRPASWSTQGLETLRETLATCRN